MKNRIRQVIADVMMLDINLINDNSSPENIEEWDSLKQMNLIIALEEEFDITLQDEDIIQMLNVGLIYQIIEDYTNNK